MPNSGLQEAQKTRRPMRIRLLTLMCSLMLALLPSVMWADDQAYVKLEVNNGADSIGAADATLSV